MKPNSLYVIDLILNRNMRLFWPRLDSRADVESNMKRKSSGPRCGQEWPTAHSTRAATMRGTVCSLLALRLSQQWQQRSIQ